jgi:hypothetical protein
MPFKGLAFWARFEKSLIHEHLYFVISDKCDDGTVLAVNLTTLRDYSDNSCILGENDHPSIKHSSFIMYRKAIAVNGEDIFNNIRAKNFSPAPPVSSKTLKKIQDGAKKSKQLPYKFKKYFSYF